MGLVIEAVGLEKTYGRTKALKGLSFVVRPGECYGLLGHNGAGKTTALRMVCGSAVVDRGRLRLFGEEIRLTPPRLKHRMGIVPQEDNLDVDLTVMENLIAFGGYFGFSRREARERAEKALAFMGLAGREADMTQALSGGLKRRLVVARALINDPELVVLDEPTTGLDPLARREVWDKLEALKQTGTTMLLTTHYMEEAARLCNRLTIMSRGAALAEGSPDELLKLHAAPWVLEIRAPEMMPDALAQILDKLELADHYSVGGTICLFADDPEQAREKLLAAGISACRTREATLEDVYLRLTGRDGQ